MLNITIDKNSSVATLTPHGALSQEDMESVSKIIDSYLEEVPKLKGVIIYADSFPGWDSFSALLAHLKFIDNHHKKVSRVAFVTNFIIGDFVEHISSHFVSAKIKQFAYEELKKAESWIAEPKDVEKSKVYLINDAGVIPENITILE